MNDVNKACSCSSGDGSLHHPCPAQPFPGWQQSGWILPDDARIVGVIADNIERGKLDHPGFYRNTQLGEVLRRVLSAALAARQPVNGLSWADYWMGRGQPDVAHDFDAFSRAEVWALQRFHDARQPVGEPVDSAGFVISNGSGEKYMAWGQVGPEWTADRSAALWLVRRADAEALAAENEDAWSILPVERCALPPNGWACTLTDGHEGPCPTIATRPAQAVDLGPGIEAAAKLIQKKASDYAEEFGYDDMGGLSFGRGVHAEVKSDHHCFMLELVDELRALIDSQAVGNG